MGSWVGWPERMPSRSCVGPEILSFTHVWTSEPFCCNRNTVGWLGNRNETQKTLYIDAVTQAMVREALRVLHVTNDTVGGGGDLPPFGHFFFGGLMSLARVTPPFLAV